MKLRLLRPALSQRGAERFWALFAPGLLLAAGLWSRYRDTWWSHRCRFLDLTGHPCPLCGGTTALRRLGEGRIGDSLHAHPLVLPGLVLLVLVTAYAWTSCVFPACPVVRVGAWHRRHTWILLAGGCAVSLALAFAR